MSDKDEIYSLNLQELDVEELEARLELGQMIPPGLDPLDACIVQGTCQCQNTTCCSNTATD